MDNFQLYRTNVLLGGQLKWDLILDLVGTKLVIKDFNISPISKSIQYDNQNKNSLLNYSHQENIKEFYKNTSGIFYENCVDSKLTSIYPIISDKIFDSHINEFEMGCKRSLYGVYGKQFEFLCPLWLEHLDDELSIEISAYAGTKNKILQKRILLSEMNEVGAEFHNRFVKYFNDYINYTGIDNGNNKVMSISLNDFDAYLQGLNVESGLINTINISNIVSSLTDRERPLIEFDSIITNQLKNNKMIVPQLINLNICFNPEDLLPASFMRIFYGRTLSFVVNIYIGNKKLELRDFYSNFEYIPRKKVGSVLDGLYGKNSPNVLDYLSDYKCIDIIDKNKMVQNIIHWSIADNNDYIFNLYEGFKGYSIIDNKIVNHSHLYDNTPDISRKDYVQSSNGIGWCNYIIVEDSNNPSKVNPADLIRNFDNYLEYSSDFSSDVVWVNKIKYTPLKEQFSLKVLMLLNKTSSHIEFNDLVTDIQPENGIYGYKDYIIIVSKDEQDLIFPNIKKVLEISSNSLLKKLLTKLNSADSFNNPPIINLKKSLYISRANSPEISSSEITYYKDDNFNEYVLRYSGNIKPTFIGGARDINFNYLYYKDIKTHNEYSKSIYSKYSKSGFLPLYPSLDYFAIKKTEYDYVHPYSNLVELYEYSWFNNSKNLILDSENNFEVIDDSKEKLEDLVKKYLSSKYNTNQEITDYIYNLYEVNSSYDYISKDDINKFKYNINIQLK